MKFLKSTLFFLCLATSVWAQSRVERIGEAFERFKNDPQNSHAIVSISVLDAKTGKKLYAYNDNLGVSTASTLKTITAATAYAKLGADFKYETLLGYQGEINAAGVLNGDLIIQGSGDPTLASWRYANKENEVLNFWVTAIRQAGIKKINGRIIGADEVFGTQTLPEGWSWQDIGNYYGAGVSGLNWRENQFDIKLKPGKSKGDAVQVLNSVPHTPFIQIINELKTGAAGSGDQAYAYLPPYSQVAYLRGSWGIGIAKSSISLSSPDPAYDAAYRLQDTLKHLGIESVQDAGSNRRLALAGEPAAKISKTLHRLESPSLSEINYWFLRKSINLYGESLIKTLALKENLSPSTANGISVVQQYWASKGIDKTALNMMDGSGLSPGNYITGDAMAKILYLAQSEPWFAAYYEGFPLYNQMKIKSGTINNVSAFAGYHTAKNGEKFIVVINVNNYNGSGINRKIFQVLDALK